jgi:hypothetical protein
VGDLSIATTIFRKNMSKTIRYVSGNRKQLFCIQSLHLISYNFKIFKEIQENEILIDDDFSTEYANKGMGGVRPCYHNCRSIRLPKLLR